MDARRRTTFIRIALVVLALPQLAIGLWALAAPRGWFGGFPGAGRQWLPLYGPYNEHFTYDIAATFLALGVLLLAAAIAAANTWLVRAAAIAYLAYQVPHSIYHWGADARLGAGDQLANGVGLAVTIVLAVAILVLSARPRAQASGAAPTSDGGAGRLSPPSGGLLARAARAYGKRRFGRPLATVDAYLHHPRLLLGYGAFETAVERSHRLDERLVALAELKAAAVVGCEWCMDFGSWLSRASGVAERQMRELPHHRESDAFSPLEKLVLDYATAMTRTPAEVDDRLVARLREHLDDAQLVELTNAIAIENHRARFNHALGIDPQGFSEGSFCVLPERQEAAAAADTAG